MRLKGLSFFFLAFLFLRCILPSNAVLGCRYLSLISSLDLQYSVFKVRSAQNRLCANWLKVDLSSPVNTYPLRVWLLKPNGLKVGLSSPVNTYPLRVWLLKPNGLKWTRTTDLTLIRRAL